MKLRCVAAINAVIGAVMPTRGKQAIHRCHFPGCAMLTPRKWLYCRPHWLMVPVSIQRRVRAEYDALPHGPEGNCLRVSTEYLDATYAAEVAIKQSLEGAS